MLNCSLAPVILRNKIALSHSKLLCGMQQPFLNPTAGRNDAIHGACRMRTVVSCLRYEVQSAESANVYP